MADKPDAALIEQFLRDHGLIDPGYSGPVQVTAETSSGTETVTINV
jgi:hypothetical protein